MRSLHMVSRRFASHRAAEEFVGFTEDRRAMAKAAPPSVGDGTPDGGVHQATVSSAEDHMSSMRSSFLNIVRTLRREHAPGMSAHGLTRRQMFQPQQQAFPGY